jgi:membrane-bound lytic murein transglycosylase F
MYYLRFIRHIWQARVFSLVSLPILLSFLIASSAQAEEKILKVLTWSSDESYLPRAGYPLDLEMQYLQRFAQANQLKMLQVPVKRFDELIPKLLAGEGDVISANLTVTGQRKKQLAFTQPFIQTHEYLLMGKNSKPLRNGKDLNGREVVVQKSKSFHKTALGLKKAYPGLKIRYINENISVEQLYDNLASGEYDLSLQDKNLLNTALKYRDDIKVSLQASGKRDIAWAVAPINKILLKDLNTFLQQQNLAASLTQTGKKATKAKLKKNKTQWQQIKANNTVRFVLRNNLSSYYIWRGELLGFNYELAKQFAKEHNLRYEIIVAPDNVSMLDYLLEDKADIALGYLTPTQQRRNKGLDFSRPYHYASELVIAQERVDDVKTPSDLSGHTIHVRPSSSYWETAQQLQEKVKGLKLEAVAETIETETIIENIASGDYDLTIADSHIVDMELTFRDDIQSLMSLGEPKPQSWAVKKGHEQLLKQSNQFIKKHYRGLFYNVVYNKYFKNKRRLDKHYTDYSDQKNTGTLSPYDKIVKKFAKQYDFDWRLMISQMHQESRFNPKAKSMAGAKGLFQVMPRTAKELGIEDLNNPKSGIQAGIRYMDWVRQRMQKHTIQPDQLLWFSLASYNAGAGHVRDAMRLAKKKGWRDDVWFENVEKAMLLLSQRKYAAKARYGYVRGKEPVDYVRAIKQRYETYQHVVASHP